MQKGFDVGTVRPRPPSDREKEQTVRMLRRAGRKVTIAIVDDFDGTEADETVSFGLDGVNREIDLSTTNANEFRKALMPYIDQATISYLDERPA